MSNNHFSKSCREHKRYSIERDERKRAKRHRKAHKVMREMEKRDRKVTEEHGITAHGACGRKKRYRSQYGANTYIRWHPTKDLHTYKCPYCGGWHLTSHPHPAAEEVDGGDVSVRDVLELAREAAIEIRRYEDELQLKLEAIGPQGYSMGPHSKNGILDPMRKVDDLIDAQASVPDRSELQRSIDEGYEIMAGIERVSDPVSVEVATRYYLQGESWRDVARSLEGRSEALSGRSRNEQVTLLQRAMDSMLSFWDEIGIAHLKEMGR